MKEAKRASRYEKGIALVIVTIILSFLLMVGLMLITVTGTGPRVAGNIRTQQQAFNAAEAGFDVSWTQIEDFFATAVWNSFDGRYLTEPAGVDDPTSENYFRIKSNLELLNLIDPDGDGNPDVSNVIFCRQPYIKRQDGSFDTRYTYTVFLIDDEVASATPNHTDALLVCIGCVGIGNNLTATRLEIELAVQL